MGGSSSKRAERKYAPQEPSLYLKQPTPPKPRRAWSSKDSVDLSEAPTRPSTTDEPGPRVTPRDGDAIAESGSPQGIPGADAAAGGHRKADAAVTASTVREEPTGRPTIRLLPTPCPTSPELPRARPKPAMTIRLSSSTEIRSSAATSRGSFSALDSGKGGGFLHRRTGLELREDGIAAAGIAKGIRSDDVEVPRDAAGEETVLGRGAQGVVKLGRLRATAELVSVKVMRATADDRDACKEIVNEVRAMMAVTSPNLVRLHGAYVRDSHVHLVREYFDFGSLADLRGRLGPAGVLPPAIAANVFAQIASGLTALHAVDIVHRDMKPGNVLINLRGEVKVGDFGIARSAQSTGAAGCGTAAYAAPERLDGGAGGREADVWALGMMAYEALTGDAPHRKCETLTAVWEFATRGSLPRLPAGAPAQLATFVELSVQRDPAARASAATLAALPFSPRATGPDLEMFLRSPDGSAGSKGASKELKKLEDLLSSSSSTAISAAEI